LQEHDRLAKILLDEKVLSDEARRMLADVGITDPGKAGKNVQLLAGRGPAYDAFSSILPWVLRSLDDVADPDAALNNWERLVGTMHEPERHYEYLEKHPRNLEILLKVIGTSQYLTDVLIRWPRLFHEVFDDDSWERSVDARTLRDELASLIGNARDYDARADVLRTFKQRHMLAAGAKDICGIADVEQTLDEITALAEACVQVAFECTEAEVRARFGKPMCSDGGAAEEASAVVIAFGKLGGSELNYSSDIDLLFMYSADGETQPDGQTVSITNLEYFSKLAERCIDLLGRVTERGHLFRVDMRLRPMGSKGPLVGSLESHLDYYEIFGETWERQAFLKARCVAGDVELGRRFLDELRPFVYPKYLDHKAIREMQNLKRRIERQVATGGHTRSEVKLGRGGIRDIEFTVQFLQLLNGGKHPELRSTNTLAALETLERIGYLSSTEHEVLVAAYRFLRRLENRLQIMQNRQLHVLPSHPEEIEVLARGLGHGRSGSRPAREVLEREYAFHTDRVRELFNKFFGKMFADDGRTSPVVDLIMNPEPTEAEMEAALQPYGFRDNAAAYRNLQLLARGGGSTPYPLRTRNFFCGIAPMLVQQLQRSPDPDMALNNLQRCVAALGAPSTFYEVLSSNPKSIDLLVALSSYSDHLIRLLVNDPGVIDFLLSTRMLEEESSRANIDKALGKFLEINPNFYEAVQRFKNGELLRIGLRDILSLADITEVTRELSSVAEVMLDRVYGRCLEEHGSRYGEPCGADGSPATMCILGMGKLGGREMNYASDLDVIFVYSAEGSTSGGTSEAISCQQFFTSLAAQVMKKMSELNPYGYLYKMDARLRPDGEQGLLAVSVDSFADYHCRKSALWEKRAMTKLRTVAGDMELGKRIVGLAQEIIYAPDFFSVDVVEDAALMLHKMIGAVGADDRSGMQIKNAEGGIVGIEFLVQLLQLKHGASSSALRTTNTMEALDALGEGGFISRKAHEDLRAALVLLRRVENRLRLMHDRSLTELPSDRDALDKLALRLGTAGTPDRSAGEVLVDMIESYIQRSRRTFEAGLKALRSAHGTEASG
jgi:glutamate-ammonia-ligase adenylyltransferase